MRMPVGTFVSASRYRTAVTMRWLIAAISLLIASPACAINIIALDCVDVARPDVTITYVIDPARQLAQIKTQRRTA